MSRDEKLAQIAANDTDNYVTRKQALDDITDRSVLDYLAKNAKDDWIRLESAIQTNNISILKELTENNDEGIRLEAAIELNDQDRLTRIVFNSKDGLHRDLALKNIISKAHLREIIDKSTSDQEKVKAAIRLGDKNVCKELVAVVNNEDLLLNMAKSLNDSGLFTEIYGKTSDSRIREIAETWLEDLKIGAGIDID